MNYHEFAEELFSYNQALRRDFHKHPELGYQEFRTSEIVAKELRQIGLDVTTGIAKTGVVGLLVGGKPGKTLLVRFDMDALPIQEETGTEYASVNTGIMHACGHDAHTAIGLTVARMLAAHRDDLPGVVKFVFQPAEEGLNGAEAMVEEGVMANPRPDASLALHVWNNKPVNWLGITTGPVMAASEVFTITVKGSGGHGASPHQTIDPIVASAQIVNSLQTIVSRNVNPLEAGVISVTTIHGGEAFNVIPPEVKLSGTVRTFDPGTRKTVLERMRRMIEKTAAAFNCEVEFDSTILTPAVINDAQITDRVAEIAASNYPDTVLDRNEITMGSEDMAYMMQDVPGCYIFIGSANPDRGIGAPHHHPKFDIDERALTQGAGLMASVVRQLLSDG